MAFETYHGQIVMPGPANVAALPVPIIVTGMPFQPELLLWYCACTATFDATQTGVMTCFGAARTTTEQFTIATASDGSGTTSNTGHIARYGTECICMPLNGTPAIDALATFVQMNADGFQVNCTDKAATNNMQVNYLALGGADLTDVGIQQVTPVGTTNGQTQSVTFGFAPDCVLIASPGVPGLTSGATEARFNFGVARRSPSTQQYAVSWFEKDGSAAMDTLRYSTQSRMGASADAASTKDFDFSIQSWDATGVTIIWNDAPAATTTRVYMIALKGGQYELEYITGPTSAQTVSHSTGFRPVGLLGVGTTDSTDTDTTVATANGDAGLIFGACDSEMRQGAIAITETDDSATAANALSKRQQSWSTFTRWLTGTAGTLAAAAQVPLPPTLVGQTSASGATNGSYGEDEAQFSKFTASASGDVAALWCRLGVTPATAGEIQLGIYADSSGVPGARLGFGSYTGNPATGLFRAVLGSPVTVVSGTAYWLAVLHRASAYNLVRSTATGTDARWLAGQTAGLPATAPATSADGGRPAIFGVTATGGGLTGTGFDLQWTTATAGTRRFAVLSFGDNPTTLLEQRSFRFRYDDTRALNDPFVE